MVSYIMLYLYLFFGFIHWIKQFQAFAHALTARQVTIAIAVGFSTNANQILYVFWGLSLKCKGI